MTEMEWADFATGLADFENASASYCPGGEQVCSLAAMQEWQQDRQSLHFRLAGIMTALVRQHQSKQPSAMTSD